MLTKSEAAGHCGRSIKRFEIKCPVQSIRFANGDVRWDVRDLDAWIDTLKAGFLDSNAEAIIQMLGS
jgi:hypothetical protein